VEIGKPKKSLTERLTEAQKVTNKYLVNTEYGRVINACITQHIYIIQAELAKEPGEEELGSVAEALAERDRCIHCEGSSTHCDEHLEVAQIAYRVIIGAKS
jgi:hypothetical protein